MNTTTTTTILFAFSLSGVFAYDLFHPVPTAAMRDLSADRPDTTESPVTVDAGHIQIEASLYDFSRERSDDVHTFGATNVKFGLTDCTDLQFVFDSYIWDEGADAEGFGDITMRYKWNLWGNDGGRTAFAVFPFVKIPTGTAISNDEWEGGLILPFSIDLAEGWSLGLMAEADVVADDAGSHDFEFIHTAVLGHDITERLGGYLEYVGAAAEDGYRALGSAGLTYMLNPNLMIDGGCRIGLNDAAEDFGMFTGITVRF
ncbi:MAG: transporter [Verrucomicrobiota bacterium]